MLATKARQTPTHIPNCTLLQSLILRQLESGPQYLTDIRDAVFSNEFVPPVFDATWYDIISQMQRAGWVKKIREGRTSQAELTADGVKELQNYQAFSRFFNS